LILSRLAALLIRIGSSIGAPAVRAFSVVWVVRLFGSPARTSIIVLSDVVKIRTGLALPSPHTHITSDADSAPLLGDSPAQHCTFGKTWELLRTEDSKLGRLDLQSPVKRRVGGIGASHDVRLAIVHGFCIAIICRLLCLLVKVETKTILSLVANRKIGEDEVARLGGSIKVGHSRDWHSRQDWDLRRRWLWEATMRCDDTRHFQSSKKEEVGIVRECDVFLLLALSLEDAKFNNRRWVNRPSISGCWTMSAVQHDGILC
jgi:hypothetical protein